MKLHPIQHDLPGPVYCGPAALSAITGLPTSRCQRAIQEANEDPRPVEGTNIFSMALAARRLGFRLVCVWEEWGYQRSVSFATFCRKNAYLWKTRPVLVRFTGHYSLVEGRFFLDAHVPGFTPIHRAPHQRRVVMSAWKVVKLDSAKKR